MKLLSIGAFVLLVASAASLVSGGQSSKILQQSWLQAADVLPERTINELETVIPAYTERVFGLLPPTLRHKVAARMRLLLAWHLAPAFLIAGVIGFLEGSWARSNQKGLVKIHSPMRFSLALAGVGLTPAAILLWATAPLRVPVIVVVLSVFTLAIFSIRNLIVHAPTQF